MSKTLEQYVNDGYVVIPARIIAAAGIFASNDKLRPILGCVRVFRNDNNEIEAWSTDSYRALRLFWPDKVNGDNKYDLMVNLVALKATKIVPARPKLDQYVAIMSNGDMTSVTLLNHAVGKHYDEGGSATVKNVDGKYPNMKQLWKFDWTPSRIRSLPTLNAHYTSDMFKCADVALSVPKDAVLCEFYPGENSFEPVCFIARSSGATLCGMRAEMLLMPVRK